MTFIVGFTGPKRAGKDTAAQALPPSFVRMAFADPLRDMLRALGLTEEELLGPLKEQELTRFGLIFSPRYLLQTLGTEWGRQLLNNHIWVNVLEQRIIKTNAPYVVITDVRMANEAAFVRRHGVLIHIEPDPRRSTRGTDTHASEAGVPFQRGDCQIVNDSTVDHLHMLVRRIVSERIPHV